jgi:hypothetical protein
MDIIGPPDRSECAEYYTRYIEQVPAGDIRQVLNAQLADLTSLYSSISEEQSTHRYAPDKWTIRQVAGHINDTERVFSFRAFWFGRGLEAPMPSFDQDIAIKVAGADDRSWQSHIDEFRGVRSATIAFFNALPADAWTRRGVASDNPVTVRALAYIVAGHAAHHAHILRERYLRA